MNAAEAIKEAAAVGIHIAVDGDHLVLEASDAPPVAVLDMLSRHKSDIVSLLRSTKPHFEEGMAALGRRCPAYVEPELWRQCIVDARRFLEKWGRQAEALGWTVRDLFGLHEPPLKPHPSYNRLGRYDVTGLLWLLRGHPVVAITDTSAAIQTGSGSLIIYRRHNNPAMGPVGDSLADLT